MCYLLLSSLSIRWCVLHVTNVLPTAVQSVHTLMCVACTHPTSCPAVSVRACVRPLPAGQSLTDPCSPGTRHRRLFGLRHIRQVSVFVSMLVCVFAGVMVSVFVSMFVSVLVRVLLVILKECSSVCKCVVQCVSLRVCQCVGQCVSLGVCQCVGQCQCWCVCVLVSLLFMWQLFTGSFSDSRFLWPMPVPGWGGRVFWLVRSWACWWWVWLSAPRPPTLPWLSSSFSSAPSSRCVPRQRGESISAVSAVSAWE